MSRRPTDSYSSGIAYLDSPFRRSTVLSRRRLAASVYIVAEEVTTRRCVPGLLVVRFLVFVPPTFPRVRCQPIPLHRIETDQVLLIQLQNAFRLHKILSPRTSRSPQWSIVVWIAIAFRNQGITLIHEGVPIVTRIPGEGRIMPPVTVGRIRVIITPVWPGVRWPEDVAGVVTLVPPVVVVQIVIAIVTLEGAGSIIVGDIRQVLAAGQRRGRIVSFDRIFVDAVEPQLLRVQIGLRRKSGHGTTSLHVGHFRSRLLGSATAETKANNRCATLVLARKKTRSTTPTEGDCPRGR